MKLVKKTNSTLCMKQGIYWVGLILSLVFGGIPSFMILMISTDIGVTETSCERIGTTQIDCIRTQSRYYGFVESTFQFIPRVTEARFIRNETKDDFDCDDTQIDNSVALITDSGLIITAAAEECCRNNEKGDEKEMREIAGRLSDFLKSDEPFVSVRWDNRFTEFNLVFIGFAGRILKIATRSRNSVFSIYEIPKKLSRYSKNWPNKSQQQTPSSSMV